MTFILLKFLCLQKKKLRDGRLRPKAGHHFSTYRKKNEVPIERAESTNRKKKRRRQRPLPPYQLDNEAYVPCNGMIQSNRPRMLQKDNHKFGMFI